MRLYIFHITVASEAYIGLSLNITAHYASHFPSKRYGYHTSLFGAPSPAAVVISHACVLETRAGSEMQRRRGSVRPEQPERTVTMSFSIRPTDSQPQYRAPSSSHTATEPHRQLCPPAAGCPGEREGLWHRRTLFWRTSSGVQVVSPRVGASCG